MKPYIILLPIFLLVLQTSALFGQISINELMADNETTIADDQGDFEDWIEIYNGGATAVDLAGYFISDDPTDNQLWQIPSSNAALTTVPANGYLILWADKDTGDGENHIDLKLSSGGETLTLTAPDGTTADQVVFGAQNKDISLGRSQNGGGSFQFFNSPTPNASNEVLTTPTFTSIVSRKVSQESDDAIEYGYSSQGMNIDHFGMIMTETWNTQKIGVRFQNIPIPSGATITSASIQFTCKDPTKSTGPSNLTIKAQKTNADPFQEINSNISQRSVTSSSVVWQPNEWTLAGLAGPNQLTSDLSSIIQEVVDQGSWEAGNNLAFIIEGTGQRSADNFTSGDGPSLKITFEAPIPTSPISNISINEISASGTDFEDENGSKSDWIELYNDNNFPVSVGGLYLTDKTNNLTKWQIGSSTPIPAKGFLTIFADEEPSSGGFHADFKISGDGETISLVQAIGNNLNILDQVDSREIPFKTSAGRSTEGANDWILFGIQTPNSPNDGTLSWLDTPEFSLNHGVYTNTQTLVLSHNEPGVTIRYTTDNTDPENTSTVYTQPITVDETMAVRARAFKSGHVPSKIKTKSYLFDASATLPVVMITTDPDNLYNDEIGIYTIGTNGINAGFCSNNVPVNYWQDWERPAHITFFETDGEEKFAVNAGIKISGNCSRRNALKSLNIYLRGNTYGDGDIDYKLFPNRDFKKYKRLRLRNSGQDYKHTMFRDGTNHQILAEVTDVEYQSYRPTIVYINGEYFGIQNFRDLYGDEYFDGIFDVSKDELDLVKNPRIYTDIKQGDDVHYQSLYDFTLVNDLSDPANFEYFKTQFDIENLIDYWISMMYVGSSDWPANNLQVWRPRTSDGKWRYMYLDSDASTSIFGGNSTNGYEWDTFGEVLNPNQTGWPYDSRATLFIRKLLVNQEFQDEFIQRTCSFMELILNEERAHSFINASIAAIDDEMDDHLQRWAFDNPYLLDRNDWQEKINRYTKFFTERPSYFYDDMKTHFNLGPQFELTFDYDSATNGEVLLHWKEMSIPYDYTGTYYTNMPIRIKAVADEGFKFEYWLETGDTNAEIDFVSNGNQILTPIFQTLNSTCDPSSADFQDSDNDGVCDDDDCDINNPNLPATPGTSCDDGDLDTSNDIILADGCTCLGTPVSIDHCDDLLVTATNREITISGLDGAPISYIQIFDSNWSSAYRCFGDCNIPTQVVQLPEDIYYVKISLYDSSYHRICSRSDYYTLTDTGGGCGGLGGDSDNDGICADEDCDDNDPNLPNSPGKACNDNDPTTDYDQFQSDGCTCLGTPTNTGDYCEAKADSSVHDWISNVSFGQINNSSGKSQYTDFTGLSTDIQIGLTYDISLETGYQWETFDEHWGIWIDFNSDNVFSNSELIFSRIMSRPQSGTENATITGQITMSNFAPTQGPTRMRVVMSRGEAATPCDTHPFGEVEDYSINISAPRHRLSSLETKQKKLRVSPNPAMHNTNIHLPENDKIEEIKMYNSNGILIKTITDIPEDISNFDLNLEDLEEGLYILYADSKGKQSQITRFIILR